MRAIAICDDNKEWLGKAAGIVYDYLKEQGKDLDIICYNDTKSCIEGLPQEAGVLFMDIEWEQPDGRTTEPKGIVAATEINAKYPDCRIVYLTNHLGYALDVYHTEHAWYVLKEQFEERLPEVFEKLAALEEESRRDIVLRTDDGRVVKILCREICHAERSGRKTRVVTDKDELVIREKISELEKILPASGFARCHNSIIVNLAKVKEIYQGCLVMEDGTEILISRGHSRSFRAEYMNWAKGRMM